MLDDDQDSPNILEMREVVVQSLLDAIGPFRSSFHSRRVLLVQQLGAIVSGSRHYCLLAQTKVELHIPRYDFFQFPSTNQLCSWSRSAAMSCRDHTMSLFHYSSSCNL